MTSTSLTLLLASSSPYRKQLLRKIVPNFTTASPDIDECKKPNESLETLAARLAQEKALALAPLFMNHLIIGSDQVACLETEDQQIQLTKPQTAQNCFEQLKACQGKTVRFYTGLCVYNSYSKKKQICVEQYETKFRRLSDEQIRRYIEKEPALDCAGGFKMEGLGIILFEHIRGDDPNTLIGLPLIKLTQMLENEGIEIL